MLVQPYFGALLIFMEHCLPKVLQPQLHGFGIFIQQRMISTMLSHVGTEIMQSLVQIWLTYHFYLCGYLG
jgi:hypothetical protein